VQVKEPVRIDSWVAYGPDGPIGLDPAQWYCVFPGAPSGLPLRLTRLPKGARVSGTRIADEYCLVLIDGTEGSEVAWATEKPFVSLHTPKETHPPGTTSIRTELPTTLLFAFATPKPVAASAPLPLDEWSHNLVCGGRITDAAKPLLKQRLSMADEAHLGYRLSAPLGGKGSEYSIDGFIALPKSPPLSLRAHAGMWGGSGDGVNFVVRVNGREIWRQFRKTERGWQEVNIPLKKYAGKAIVLSLAVDCGPSGYNTSCDNVIWGDPTLAPSEK